MGYAFTDTACSTLVPTFIRTRCQVTSGNDSFLQAAADGGGAASLLSTIMEAPFAIAVGGSISFELFISACVRSHADNLLIELKTI